ncbi:Zinc finger protein 41 [Trachymyrmex septentrionalis]|uniref:Zinc finger protein 41 n=1 Tax=Trachymyrmex septentrionalis TaxID=34720 RepID=A0A195FS62_9HYME|nr:Zinc finger protein 41 [Trachymyrmex septentrionalis]
MSSLDYLDLCRLCLVKDRVSVPIFEGEGDVRQIFLKITACLPVKVNREDKLPKKICDDCVYKVELCYQFWHTTANAEKQLLQWLGEVNMEDKQGYNVLNPNGLKSDQNNENRLDGTVMQQVSEHQNNMNMSMMDNMSLSMPMMMSSNTQQQITSVPMDNSGSSVQNVQPVAGPSTQTTHDQITQNQTDAPTQQEEEDESSDEDENSDDECDGDEGLPIKEESEEDPNNRTIEPTTFVNVSLACDEAGPSGLQQQKITDMPEIVIPQTSDVDPKTGHQGMYNSRGIFIFGNESLVMKTWQILEFDGKPYYAFVPEGDVPLPDEDTLDQVESLEEEAEIIKNRNIDINNVKQDYSEEEYVCTEQKSYNVGSILNESVEEIEELDIKPIILNGINEAVDGKTVGDLYQVKVEGSMVTIEKLTSNTETDGKTTEDQDINDDEGEIEYLEEAMLDVPSIAPLPSIAPSSNKASRMKTPAKNSSEAMKCKLCSETFDTILAFRKHVAWSHKKKMCIIENDAYICAVCGFKTQKKSLFAAHLDRKHETWKSRRRSTNTKFPCSACGFICRSKHSLQSHFTRKHTDKYEHQCSFCSKKFKVKGDLTNHIRFHHKEKPVKCDVCGKLCLNSGSLYVHQKWAHYKPQYECHICKRRMVTQENLDQHLVTQHEKRDKIVCAECGKTFTKKDSFKRHMVVHTGCKPHSCMICNKPFARRSQLRQHLLIHTGKRPFVCDICGKAFTQKPGLICHRKTHPGQHPPLPVMPIADFVKEFTDGYVQEMNAPENDDEINEEEVLNI